MKIQKSNPFSSSSFKIIVLSHTHKVDNEERMIADLFEAGMEYFHIRKPKYSTWQLGNFIKTIPKKYRDRIILHSHHELALAYELRGIHLTRKHKKRLVVTWLKNKFFKWRRPDLKFTTSLHSLSRMYEYDPKFEYVFLSPVFDSISKIGYKAAFNEASLKEVLSKTQYKVIALGGIELDTALRAKELGFAGVALLGGIWESKAPVEFFKQIKIKCDQQQIMF